MRIFLMRKPFRLLSFCCHLITEKCVNDVTLFEICVTIEVIYSSTFDI